MTPPDDYNHFPGRLTPPDPDTGAPSLPDEEGRIPHYEDTGCSFSPSCLSCALPRCVLDMTPSQVAQLRRARLRGGRPLTATETAVESLVDRGSYAGRRHRPDRRPRGRHQAGHLPTHGPPVHQASPHW